MSLRSIEAAQRKGLSGITLNDLKEGQKVDGIVKKIEEYGLFIQIEGSKLSGLCHKSQVSCLLISTLQTFLIFIFARILSSYPTMQPPMSLLPFMGSVRETVSRPSLLESIIAAFR